MVTHVSMLMFSFCSMLTTEPICGRAGGRVRFVCPCTSENRTLGLLLPEVVRLVEAAG